MRSKVSIVTGSLLGAVVIHLVVLACSARGGGGGGGIAPVDGSASADAAGADGGPRASDGGILDAMMMMLQDTAAALTDVVADTAAMVRDAEVRDAHAGGGGRTIEVPCDRTGGYQLSFTGSPTTTESTTYYAIATAAVAPYDAPDVRAVVCDRVEDPNPCAYYAGMTTAMCRASGHVPSRDACNQAQVSFDAGRVIVNCGFVTRTMNATSTITNSIRHRRAFIHLP